MGGDDGHDIPTATGISFDEPRAGDEDPGLVLVFAEERASLPAAFPLTGRRTVVGRTPPADIVLPLASVSRLHAELALDADVFLIRDLESTNGVVVDGVKVKEAPLAHDQIVRIGDVLFKFVVRGALDYAAYRMDEGLAGVGGIEGMIGGAQMALVAREVASAAPTSFPVLVTGESGTGKELVARAIHAASGRAGPFVAVNCAAIPDHLVESELFGFKKGAFSGASKDHPGLFRAASGGTLLLDEIGDMPLPAQAKLLRTLETREVQPLGGIRSEHVDVRIVAATHRDLRQAVDAGTFRGDLHARLNGYGIALPPLRKRKEDLYRLVRHLALVAAGEPREPTFRFMLAVCNYDWPYNVRELASAVRRAVAAAPRGPLEAAHLPDAVTELMADYGKPREAPQDAAPSSRRVLRPTASELATLLRAHDGNLAAVGRVLGKDRAQVHRWLQQLGIDPTLFRRS